MQPKKEHMAATLTYGKSTEMVSVGQKGMEFMLLCSHGGMLPATVSCLGKT